jgi:hypothetical protein
MTALYNILNGFKFGVCLEHRSSTYLQMKNILLAAKMWSKDYDFIYVAREQGNQFILVKECFL